MNNIFIGIVTHKREKFFHNLIHSISNIPWTDNTLMVYKDGSEFQYHDIIVPHGTIYLEAIENKGVGYTKSRIIEEFKISDKDHLFIIEDDVLVKDIGVFDYFIKFSECVGIKHINWNNCTPELKSPRFAVQYDAADEMTAIINRDCSGAFQYFHKDIINHFSIDLEYKNAWEHVDIELQLCIKGYNPPFWAFITPKHVDKYLAMQDPGNGSTITQEPQYKEFLYKGYEYFQKKWGFHVKQIPIVSDQMVIEYLVDRRKKS